MDLTEPTAFCILLTQVHDGRQQRGQSRGDCIYFVSLSIVIQIIQSLIWFVPMPKHMPPTRLTQLQRAQQT